MSDRPRPDLDQPSIGRRLDPRDEGWRARTAGPPEPTPFDQHGFRGRLDWGLAGVRALAPVVDLIVVVDVLSFSTAVSIAIEQGARVAPYAARDGSAGAHAKAIGATLASPNRTAFGPTLSPTSLRALRAGELLLLPSPNGSACVVEAASAGPMVVAGCIRNASAVAALVAGHGGSVGVIAAGEGWPGGGLRPSVEDLVGAGAALDAVEPAALSPEARAAVAAFRAVRNRLPGALAESASGRELIADGFERDVDLAAELDATDLVPVLVDGIFSGGMG